MTRSGAGRTAIRRDHPGEREGRQRIQPSDQGEDADPLTGYIVDPICLATSSPTAGIVRLVLRQPAHTQWLGAHGSRRTAAQPHRRWHSDAFVIDAICVTYTTDGTCAAPTPFKQDLSKSAIGPTSTATTCSPRCRRRRTTGHSIRTADADLGQSQRATIYPSTSQAVDRIRRLRCPRVRAGLAVEREWLRRYRTACANGSFEGADIDAVFKGVPCRSTVSWGARLRNRRERRGITSSSCSSARSEHVRALAIRRIPRRPDVNVGDLRRAR